MWHHFLYLEVGVRSPQPIIFSQPLPISLGTRVESKHLGKRKMEEGRKTDYFREQHMGGKGDEKQRVKGLNIGNQSKVPRIAPLRAHLQGAARS